MALLQLHTVPGRLNYIGFFFFFLFPLFLSTLSPVSRRIISFTVLPQKQIRDPLDEERCFTCPQGSLPDNSHSKCDDIPEEFLKPDSGWAIGAMSFSATGILVSQRLILTRRTRLDYSVWFFVPGDPLHRRCFPQVRRHPGRQSFR